MQGAIHHLKKEFISLRRQANTERQRPDPLKGSAAKEINMFLRWMVRKDRIGVDFGLRKNISPYTLSYLLDLHTGNVARKLGLLKRKQNDTSAVFKLDAV